MNWLTLIKADLTRAPMRTSLTAVSLVIAFLLFGLLQPVRLMFSEGIEDATDARLMTTPKHSVADMLPVRYLEQIAQIGNVDTVAHLTWFGGTYRDIKNFFPQYAITPAAFLDVSPELQLSQQARSAFLSNRRGAIVGASTAKRFGWQIGDKISLIPNIWHNRDDTAWEFELVGIFTSTNTSLLGEEAFYFAYDYFDEYRAFANGTVGSFVLRVNDVDDLLATANQIDAEFANSPFETRTQSSTEYALSFVRQLGDVSAIATVILGSTLFTLLIVIGHAMSRSIHQRRAELAVMRVLGFKLNVLAGLLIAEFLGLVLASAAAGLCIAYYGVLQLEQWFPQASQIGDGEFYAKVAAQGTLLAILVGIAVAVFPVTQSLRTPLVSALRAEL